ncbi:MAG: hypothetical protein QF554_12780 [Dehalococcoidia bacterium]|nr:hypothetical protein [Dehalococcoidia bacterium]
MRIPPRRAKESASRLQRTGIRATNARRLLEQDDPPYLPVVARDQLGEVGAATDGLAVLVPSVNVAAPPNVRPLRGTKHKA